MTRCSRCGKTVRAADAACPECLLAPQPATEAFAGVALEDEIGRGGMGVVFRGRHLALGRAVAVKCLAPEAVATGEAKRRFEREAKAMALLDHPHIVRVMDSGEEDGAPYLVMELVDGGDLARRLPLSLPEALRVAQQVCAALAHAHERGVIHRDIKPQNVLLDGEGRAKVTDFGIARVLHDDSGALKVTATHAAVGSVGFTAPEVLTGASPAPAMDVYSLGALLRAMLTGRAPVGEMSDVAPPVALVIRRAMAERPDDRFASMAELAEALAQVDAGAALPADELLWMRAVAFVQTVALASMLWAALLSLTPRVLLKNDLLPMAVYSAQVIDDARVLSRARFEVGAILLALVAVAGALGATAWLRRHWRLERLDGPAPSAPIGTSRWVVAAGAFTVAMYILRVWSMAQGLVREGTEGSSWLAFLPFVGGLLEVAVLYGTVLTVLEATRRHRPLRREPWLWVGQGAALVPPVLEFFRTL